MSELDPRLMETLARLERRITALEARPDPAAAQAAAETEQAVWWPALDHGQAAGAWDALGAWVRELLTRYSHHAWTVRPCWRQHPEVVDELTALRLVWLDAYAPNPAARPTAAADFLTRWLPGAMTRIKAAFARSRCRTEAGKNVHAEDDSRWAVPDWTDQQVADFIEADLDGRPR